jgi:hypothetical protein
MHLLAKLLIGAVAWEGSIYTKETIERHRYYGIARRYCDEFSKPLLNVGMKRHVWEPPNGDITLDLDQSVERIDGGVWGDVRDMPFDNKAFGFVFNSHVLEHLPQPEDVELAVRECVRVADYAVFLTPSPYSIVANLFAPSHHLKLWFDRAQNKIIARPNKWRTGIGLTSGVAQWMIVEELHMPLIITDTGPLPRGFVPG